MTSKFPDKVSDWKFLPSTREPNAIVIHLITASLNVGPVGIEPTTHGLKVRCSTD